MVVLVRAPLHGPASSGEAPADVAALLGHEVGTHLSFYVQGTECGASRAAGVFSELSAAIR